jgi:hypothetical protein
MKKALNEANEADKTGEGMVGELPIERVALFAVNASDFKDLSSRVNLMKSNVFDRKEMVYERSSTDEVRYAKMSGNGASDFGTRVFRHSSIFETAVVTQLNCL